MTDKHFVVVDGSNLATEGRKTPSLAQLDEAVRAYVSEHPDAEMVVVVDASFEHRIDPKEARQLEQAELHGELVSPPAGAIGRGDAFVLRIAERTGATVLSNDSFQEFHDQHRWLFDEGRLVGGKPVPGVGWIFTPRSPVRGAKSRHADRKGKSRQAVPEMAPAEKAAELAKAAKRAAERGVIRNGDGSMPKVGDVWVTTPDGEPASEAVAPKARRAKDDAKVDGKAKKAKKGHKKDDVHAEPALATLPVAKAAKQAKPPKDAKEKPAKVTKAAKGTKATKAKKAAEVDKAPRATEPVPAPKKVAAKKAAAKKAATKATPAEKMQAKATKASKDAAKKATGPAKKATKAAKVPSTNRTVRAAIVEATAEALDPVSDTPEGNGAQGRQAAAAERGSGGKRKRRRAAPPPAVNEPMSFINFVAAYPMGSEVEGDVASFTSHGAMVEVPVPGGGAVYCYIPMTGLGDPPPAKARDVISRGERRTFVLMALDPARRVAELALPEVAKPARAAKPAKKAKAAKKVAKAVKKAKPNARARTAAGR
jgi:hypothetical protein